jgi:hypothetical protein
MTSFPLAEEESTEALALKAFLAALRPEDQASISFTENFLEGFTRFAKTSSISNILSPSRVLGIRA